ncbi:VPA1267 family protein [Vibrio sp. WXL103]|uniref:VPA1267 family protein n=1 Tax=Vibrio sp. WXL103 TaxID=3450710 RepID=UPI003EC8772B
MASGQQKALQNLEAFEVWKATQTDDGFKQIVFRGQLNRIEVAKGIGCGKSALNQNPALKKTLKAGTTERISLTGLTSYRFV